MYINNNFAPSFKLEFSGITYKVNEEKGIVTALENFCLPFDIRGNLDRILRVTGIAKLNKEAGDKFDVKKGMKIARAKAEKEAFIQFKVLLLRYAKNLVNLEGQVNDSINNLANLIKHQSEYIKTF